jgi:glutathione S-transferase
VPDGYTVADAYLIVFYRWGEVVDVDLAQYGFWTALTARTMLRPVVVASVREDGLLPLPS